MDRFYISQPNFKISIFVSKNLTTQLLSMILIYLLLMSFAPEASASITSASINRAPAKSSCISSNFLECQNFVRNEIHENRKDSLKVFLKKSCSSKNRNSCLARALILRKEGRFQEATKTLMSICKINKLKSLEDTIQEIACVELAENLGRSNKKADQSNLLNDLCKLGSPRACTTYASILSQDEGTKNLANRLNTSSCDKGYSPACFNLKLQREHGVATENECKKGDLFSCTSYASLESDFEQQRIKYRTLCTQHIETACKLLRHLEAELGMSESFQESESEFKKILFRRCDQDDGSACFALAKYFADSIQVGSADITEYSQSTSPKKSTEQSVETTKSIEKKIENKRQIYAAKAQKILSKGCQQGDDRSCKDLKDHAMRSGIIR